MPEVPRESLSPQAQRVIAALEGVRKNLLDLTLRNRLLNYRPSKVRGITVVEEDGRQIYRRLVPEDRSMGFTGVPDRRKDDSETASTPAARVVDTTDDKLNTRYEVSVLQDRLLRTWSDARTVLEEQGINTLFLAIGMLEWIETDDSEKVLKAPLLLVPVALERGERGRFRLKWTGEDLGVNLSLAVKVKEEFQLDWPKLPEVDEIDVGVYLDAVERTISGQRGWVIQRDAIVVDFFSYAKYLMFKDLDPAGWPAGRKPHEHGVVAGLLSDGIGRDEPLVPDPSPLDDHRPPESAFEICDADSSQTLVLIDVAAGKNMVVEGPPGTGKSQTIENVLAEAVANGKTVLFVAEKMAALEVVKRRLDQYQLGDACLELHSHKTRKRELLQELGRTLGLSRLQLQGVTEHAARLLETRGRLNDYARELHRPVEPSGWTPFEAQGELARITLAADLPPRGQPHELQGLKREEFEERRRSIRNLQAKIREIGMPNKHPYFGCAPVDFLPGDVPALATALGEGCEAVDRLQLSSQAVAACLKSDNPLTASEAGGLALAAEQIAAAPHFVFNLSLADPRWHISADEILGVLRAGVRRKRCRDSYAGILRDDAWGENVESLITDLDRSGGRWNRVFQPGFYRSRRQLKALCRGATPKTHDEKRALALAIREEAECSRRIREKKPLMSEICGTPWKGPESDFVSLLAAGKWAVTFHGSVANGDIPPTALRFFDGDRSTLGLSEAAANVRADIASMSTKNQAIFNLLRPSPTVFALPAHDESVDVGRLGLARLATWLVNAAVAPGRVLEQVAYNRLRNICATLGLGSLCEIADAWDGAGVRLEDAMLQVWCEMIVRQASRERPALAKFERVSHENLLEEFRRLDREMIEINRQRVRARHREKLPYAVGAGATGLLREQINLNRRQKPIRRLMQECAGPIQALKPVFMMSPFSVAMFLAPDGPRFDLVVFDEASQVRPADSLGALLRANQAVVVGDSHQLPPTSFFENTLADADDEGDDDESIDPHVAAGDMESILSLMRARGADVRDLQWHYRSKHASLIRVSSHEFYPQLEVFPSPEETSANVGLKLHHLPSTVYGRGNSRTNIEEAKAVAKAIQNHARTSPDLTLGVAAFSVSQQMAILRQLELLQRDDASLEAFGGAHPNEPLFVKNLENVQGDERDVIFISVGYGRDAENRLTLNFGPLNQEGGERRLNVLISRARQRCEVFSNFTADDLALPVNAPMGLRLLKTYLKFAACGDLDVPSASGRAPDSPFEESVLKFLTRDGHNVEPQVGSAGYFIDLAVVDPDRAGRYLIGIECDGAKYHSARSARDRDRLREQVLRSKGWRIHRIWSTSWFHENEAERRRLLSAIQAARLDGDTPTPAPSPGPVTDESAIRVTTVPLPSGGSLTVPYATAQVDLNLHGKELHEVWVGTLAETVTKVVAVESPVHVEEVIRRIRSAVAVQRAGNRIREAFDLAIRHAAQQQTIVVRGKFLWVPGMSMPPVRDRSGLSDGGRNLEVVAPEEIQQLIVGVVAGAFRIRADDLASEVVRLFGFARLTVEMRARVDSALSMLVKERRLELDGDLIRRATSQDAGRA